MPKPRSSDPRDRQVLLRLTASELETLEAVAHLERTTANAYAYSRLVEHLAIMARDPHVERDLANRAAYDARAATATTTELKPSTEKKSRNRKSNQSREELGGDQGVAG